MSRKVSSEKDGLGVAGGSRYMAEGSRVHSNGTGEVMGFVSKMLPPVGYPGGKRRLLPRLRPHFPTDIAHYVEPFLGMGANYLDLRSRGYRGEAYLAELDPDLRHVWQLLHGSEGRPALIKACAALPGMDGQLPAPDAYRAMVATAAADPLQRAAVFLWITNYAFGNQPPQYLPEKQRWRAEGTKLTSAAKHGKRFPWEAVVARLERCGHRLEGAPAQFFSDGFACMAAAPDGAHVYADPPYEGGRPYGWRPGEAVSVDKVLSRGARFRCFVLSERTERFRTGLDGWTLETGEVIQRQSGGVGATGRRVEVLYVKGGRNRSPSLFDYEE